MLHARAISVLAVVVVALISSANAISYRCENDQVLIVQSFGNDTIRMHCQKLHLCGFQHLRCNYDQEQPSCGGKNNFVSHVNQITPTGPVTHTCCEIHHGNAPYVPNHDGNDCFVYELPDGSNSKGRTRQQHSVDDQLTVLQNAAQIPEQIDGYVGYRMKLFMLQNKSPPSLIVKAIERLPDGYRVTICRPRCGNFAKEDEIGRKEKTDKAPVIEGDIMHGKVKSPASWKAAAWSSWSSSSWTSWSTTKLVGEEDAEAKARGQTRGDRWRVEEASNGGDGKDWEALNGAGKAQGRGDGSGSIVNNVNVNANEGEGGAGGAGGQGIGGTVNGVQAGNATAAAGAKGTGVGVGVGSINGKPEGGKEETGSKGGVGGSQEAGDLKGPANGSQEKNGETGSAGKKNPGSGGAGSLEAGNSPDGSGKGDKATMIMEPDGGVEAVNTGDENGVGNGKNKVDTDNGGSATTPDGSDGGDTTDGNGKVKVISGPSHISSEKPDITTDGNGVGEGAGKESIGDNGGKGSGDQNGAGTGGNGSGEAGKAGGESDGNGIGDGAGKNPSRPVEPEGGDETKNGTSSGEKGGESGTGEGDKTNGGDKGTEAIDKNGPDGGIKGTGDGDKNDTDEGDKGPEDGDKTGTDGSSKGNGTGDGDKTDTDDKNKGDGNENGNGNSGETENGSGEGGDPDSGIPTDTSGEDKRTGGGAGTGDGSGIKSGGNKKDNKGGPKPSGVKKPNTSKVNKNKGKGDDDENDGSDGGDEDDNESAESSGAGGNKGGNGNGIKKGAGSKSGNGGKSGKKFPPKVISKGGKKVTPKVVNNAKNKQTFVTEDDDETDDIAVPAVNKGNGGAGSGDQGTGGGAASGDQGAGSGDASVADDTGVVSAPQPRARANAAKTAAAPASGTAGSGNGGGGMLACFSGDMEVTTISGTKRMDELEIGDLVLVPASGSLLKYERVEMFYHREPQTSARFVQINTESGKNLTLTALHLLPFDDCEALAEAHLNIEDVDTLMRQSKFAHKAIPGQCVLSVSPTGSLVLDRIVSISRRVTKGIYSPMTVEGSIIANGVLSSCFSQLESHAVQKLAYDALVGIYTAFGYLRDIVVEPTQEVPSMLNYIHQLSRFVLPFSKY